jgi:hypothetical protein
VTTGRLRGLRGTIVWAVSAFDVEEPFRVYQHDGSERRLAGRDLAEEVLRRELAGDFELVVGAKLRPVLLLQDRPAGRLDDYAALRLTRLEKFAGAEQQAIREGREPTLFHLGHDEGKYGMDKEYAVDLGSLHRLHRTAIVGRPRGAVDVGEFRTICERLVRVSDLDLSNLIVREAAAFVARLNVTGP